MMIGRAAIGYPWIFNEIKHFFATGELLAPPSVSERVEAVRKHLLRAIEWKGEKLGLLETRSHYTNYFRGLPNMKPFRMQLVTLNEAPSVFRVLDEIEAYYSEALEMVG
jgi:hypothetical protein